ncbi:MAG: hypothetical protein ACKVU0_20095 [Saprospiraceae bacterium]
MSKKQNLYLGKAGQFVVMSELLCRGWNVATPEVDVGDDIFVVQDMNGDLIRVQVKTATGKRTAAGIKAQFSTNLVQLAKSTPPKLVYIFAIRFEGVWQKLTLIKQDKLQEEYDTNNVGSPSGKNLTLTFLMKGNQLSCSKRDFSAYINNFEDFPMVEH